MMSIENIYVFPQDLAEAIARQAKARRLGLNLSRQTLAEKAGVPAPTLCKFERTGQASLLTVLKIADGLGGLAHITPQSLFPDLPPLDIEHFVAPARKRGRR